MRRQPGAGSWVLCQGANPVGQATAIAKADGFGSWEEMLDWFEKTHGLPFEGLLIRW